MELVWKGLQVVTEMLVEEVVVAVADSLTLILLYGVKHALMTCSEELILLLSLLSNLY